jgi:PAS domain S-box-containing protein
MKGYGMKIRDKLLLTFVAIALSSGVLGYIEHRYIGEVAVFFNSHTLVTVIAILAGVLVARSISTPLTRLSALVNRFGHGEPIAPEDVPVKGALELRQLGLAIADMIRERDALETSLKEREAFVRMLLDTSPVGFALVRMDGTLVEINSAYARIIGRSVEETLGLTYWEITPEEYCEQEQAQLKSLDRSGRYGPYEKEYLHRDGHLVPVRLSGRMIERDGEQHIWSVVEDITEQRQAVTEIKRQIQALRMTEHRLAEAQRVAHIGTWELDLVENRLWWSDEVFRIFEIDPEYFSASYEAFLDSLHPDDRDTVNRAYTESVTNRTPYDMVHRLMFNDGRIKYINKRCETFYDKTGTALRSIGTVQDITDRHRQELEKRRWHAMLNALVEGSSDAIFVKDRDSLYLIGNQALCDLLGKSKDEVMGADDFALFPEELAKQFRSDDRRIMEQAKTETYEEPVITANKTLSFLTTKGALVINDEVQGCFGISRDITPLKQVEHALRESEQRLTLLLNTLPHGIQENDTKGVITYSNIAHHRILGWKPGELIGRYIWESQRDSKHKQELRDYLVYLVEEQPLPQPYVTSNITKDGREVIVEVDWDYQRNTEGVVTGFVSVISDITTRTRIEQELKASEAKYKAILEAQPDLMFQLSDDGVHLDFYAPSFDKLYVDPKGFLGKRVDEVLPLEVSDKYRHYIRETLKTSHMQVFEYHLFFPEGSRYYDCRMVVSGKNKILASVREITDIKQAEAALRTLNQELEDRVHERTAELEAANKELESFAYSVSHDLRAPLRAIDGFSLALAEDYGDQLNEVALDYLQRVRNGAQRMGLLIDDLLQLSRMNRSELMSQQVDLGEIAEIVLQDLRAREPERRVELTLGRDMRAQGDPHLLRVMLDNLLGNAWKFTAREAVSHITFEQKTDQPGTFYVSDNGVGFDMRHADKLFGAFQRLHRVTDFPGTGVGLATVQRIVNRHGGQVWGEAREGEGATFYFCLESARVSQTKPLEAVKLKSDRSEKSLN